MVLMLVFCGYLFGVEWFKSFGDGWVTMKLATFLALFFEVIAVMYLLGNKRYQFEVVAGCSMGAVSTIGLGATGNMAAGDHAAVLSVAPGVPSLGTLGCIIAFAILFLVRLPHEALRNCAFAMLGIGGVALFLYMAGVPPYHMEGVSTAMALPTALVVTLMALALILREENAE